MPRHTHAMWCWEQVKIAEGLPKEQLEVKWKNGPHKATLRADLEDMTFEIVATDEKEVGELHSFKCGPASHPLFPYICLMHCAYCRWAMPRQSHAGRHEHRLCLVHSAVGARACRGLPCHVIPASAWSAMHGIAVMIRAGAGCWEQPADTRPVSRAGCPSWTRTCLADLPSSVWLRRIRVVLK